MENKEAVRTQLKKILSSEGFSGNEKFSRLLEYVVAETFAGRDIKEATLAADFYKKALDPPSGGRDKPSFVRVNMGKLRDKLTDYYLHAGWLDEWLIEIPKQGYVPSFTKRMANRPAPDSRALKLTIIVEADRFNDVMGLHAALCIVSGDPNLQIRGISIGSIVIHFNCSEEGYNRLCEALKDGGLVKALGYEVESLEPDTSNFMGLAEALLSLGKPFSRLRSQYEESGSDGLPDRSNESNERPDKRT